MRTFVKGNLAVLPQNVKCAYLFDQIVLFLGIYLQEILTHVHEDIGTKIFRLSVCNSDNRRMVKIKHGTPIVYLWYY